MGVESLEILKGFFDRAGLGNERNESCNLTNTFVGEYLVKKCTFSTMSG